jgi:peptidoglycan biosynthesis protein MviN/MurJ (putative lipid II flippase)
VLGIVLQRRGWLALDRDALRRLPRIVAATVVMGVVVFAAHSLSASQAGASGSLARLALLAVLVALGLAVYLASLQLLGVARLRDLIAAVRTRV